MRDAFLEESGSGKFGKKVVDFLLVGVHLVVNGTKTNGQREHASGSDGETHVDGGGAGGAPDSTSAFAAGNRRVGLRRKSRT